MLAGEITSNLNEKTFFIKTYGCQMNEYDSVAIKTALQSEGCVESDDIFNSDIIVINTCHIREKATEKVYSELGVLRIHKNKLLKDSNRHIALAVTGCVAQAEGEEIMKRNNGVDIVIGPESYQQIARLVNNVFDRVNSNIEMKKEDRSKFIELDFKPDEKFDFLENETPINDNQPSLKSLMLKNNVRPSTFVTIQEGCDKFCKFCIVPYTRGAEFSRQFERVIDEIRESVKLGAREIVLLGQNVNAYHGLDNKGRERSLSQLITEIAQIDDLKRIRYTTSHPNEMTGDLIAVHGTEMKLMPLLNLPIQSGSDKILKDMNRKYTGKDYKEIIKKLRIVRPEIVMSSDFIVAYPGETDEDFQDTIDLIKEIGFYGQSYSFKYSPREGTPAAEKNQISNEIASQRLHILQQLLEEQRYNFNQQFIGKKVSVLFDNNNSREDSKISGRTEFMQIAIFDLESISKNEKDILANKKELFGKIRDAKVVAINTNSFMVELCD
jgi:tRNA-2-methylthio-N6-dimethylallyladenosine synthase